MNRREMVNTALAFAAWPTLTPGVSRPPAVQRAAAEQDHDEQFWAGIRNQFELRTDQINVATAVRGVTPRATRERMAESTEQFNTYRASGVAELKNVSRAKAAAFINAPAGGVALLRNTTEGVGTVLLNWPLSRGDHPTAHYLALAHSLDFLTGIGVSRIQARLFALTSRWTARARAVPGFRTAVTVAPDQCAGLVAWEPDAALRPRLQEALRARRIIWGGTEPYAGFFGIPEDAPRSLPIFNVGVFTSTAEVDEVADAFESAGAAR
jgi:selenocysteine lyase/cysteine desulfurase